MPTPQLKELEMVAGKNVPIFRTVISLGLVFSAGILGAIQARVNTNLADGLDSGVLAAFISFVVSLIVGMVVLFFRPQSRKALKVLFRSKMPRWLFLNGVCGAVFVATAAVFVSVTGVALFMMSVACGQVLGGLFVDRWGVGPHGRQLLTFSRALAALIAVFAVGTTQVGAHVEGAPFVLLSFIVLVGLGMALQNAMNGRVNQASGDVVAAAMLNVTCGTALLGAIVGGMAFTGTFSTSHWPTESWLYIGGVLGVVGLLFVVTATRYIDVFRLTLANLAGLLLGGVVVDIFATAKSVTVSLAVGIIGIFVAVLVSNRTSRRSTL